MSDSHTADASQASLAHRVHIDGPIDFIAADAVGSDDSAEDYESDIEDE